MAVFRRDPLKKMQRAKEKAARLADDATQRRDHEVTLTVWSRDPIVAGTLDDAMKERGYLFKGWLSPTRPVYRRAEEEIRRERELDAATVYQNSALLRSLTSPMTPADYPWLRITNNALLVGTGDNAVSVPFSKALGYCVEENQEYSPDPELGMSYRGRTVWSTSYGVYEAPIEFDHSLYDDYQRERFESAMRQVGIPSRDYPTLLRMALG